MSLKMDERTTEMEVRKRERENRPQRTLANHYVTQYTISQTTKKK